MRRAPVQGIPQNAFAHLSFQPLPDLNAPGRIRNQSESSGVQRKMCRSPRQFEQSLSLAPGSRACLRLAAPENLQAFGASIGHRLKLSDLEAQRLCKTDDAPGQLRTTNSEIPIAF
jgi:hypothetical protein